MLFATVKYRGMADCRSRQHYIHESIPTRTWPIPTVSDPTHAQIYSLTYRHQRGYVFIGVSQLVSVSVRDLSPWHWSGLKGN